MKIRAICPACGERISRWWVIKLIPEYRHRCPACSVRIKSKSSWEWGFSALFGTLAFVPSLFLYYGKISGTVFIVIIGLLLVTMFVLFPYLTVFEVTSKDHDAT